MKKLLIGLAAVMLLTGHAEARHGRVRAKPVPTFSAKSFLVADTEGVILKEQDSDTVRPIASISKLMVGILASEQDLSERLSIPSSRTVTSTIPRKTEYLTRKELLTLALVRSDNFAAQILCDNLPNCVNEMNQRATLIGMAQTHFDEPTGLSANNVSTANDLLKLMLVASMHPVVTEVSSMPKAEITAGNKTIKINNTNPLTSKLDMILSKTGFTNPAGGCLAMMINTSVGKRILILLGSRNSKTRIPDMERLVKEL